MGVWKKPDGRLIDDGVYNDQVAVGSELRRGDVLTQINGRPCSEMTHREAAEMIKNAGTTISIVVRRYF